MMPVMLHPSWQRSYRNSAIRSRMMTSKKVDFPLTWREGMKGRGREFLTFYECVKDDDVGKMKRFRF
jgi:hypothetical protein